MSLFSRRATVAYDRNNISIVSVERLSDAIAVKLNKTDALLYMNVIMAPIDPVLDFAADRSTYTYSAARANLMIGISFILRLYTSDYSAYRDGGVSLLRSFVAIPFQFATAMRQYGTDNLMPPENRVTVTLSQSQYRAIIDSWTVWAFSWLAFPAIVYCVVFLGWIGISKTSGPNISAFPEIDIASKSSTYLGADVSRLADLDPHLEVAEQTLEDLEQLTQRHEMGGGKSMRIVRGIKGRRLYCRLLPGLSDTEGQICHLLVDEGKRLKILNRVTNDS